MGSTEGPQRRADPQPEQTRSLLQVLQPGWHGNWTVRVYVDGAAAVAFTSERTPTQVAPGDVMISLGETWQLASDSLEAVGAEGEAYLALYLQSTRLPPEGEWKISPPPMMDVIGKTSIGPPAASGLESIRRELDREAGYLSWEPEA
jgi:hypothetical protein